MSNASVNPYSTATAQPYRWTHGLSVALGFLLGVLTVAILVALQPVDQASDYRTGFDDGYYTGVWDEREGLAPESGHSRW